MTEAKGAVLVLPKACKKAYLEKAKHQQEKVTTKACKKRIASLRKASKQKEKVQKAWSKASKERKGPLAKGTRLETKHANTVLAA